MKLVARRRFEPSHDLGNPLRLEPDHPGLTEKRTLFPSRLRDPGSDGWVLKGGENQYKLGSICTKGDKKSFPIYSLSLEERASCPHCKLWNTCYGNRSPFSIRFRHGPKLIRQLSMELKLLCLRNPAGILIRLHQLGDFYSVEYVRQWDRWLDQFDVLNVFGYTHHRPSTLIGRELNRLIRSRWDRFAVRWSNSTRKTKSTRTLMAIPDTMEVDGAIVCPQQFHSPNLTCGSCSLCWASTRPIAFVVH